MKFKLSHIFVTTLFVALTIANAMSIRKYQKLRADSWIIIRRCKMTAYEGKPYIQFGPAVNIEISDCEFDFPLNQAK